MIDVFTITGINPEPWVPPEGSVGRKGGGTFVQFHKSAGLAGYQQAIKEEVAFQNHIDQTRYPVDESAQITFWLWRQRDQSDDRRQTRRQADATNMQKALEDALQGILFVNDRKNFDVRTIIWEQFHDTIPHIIIEVRTGDDFDLREPPSYPIVTPDPFPALPKPTSEFF